MAASPPARDSVSASHVAPTDPGKIPAAAISSKATLTLEGARKIIAGAVAEAARNHAGAVVAVVDEGGNLMALERIDQTFAAGAHISIGKARTAVQFKKPTKFFEDVIRNGRTPMVALDDFTPLQGGLPIVVDGQVIGGVGVSGAASAQQDEEVAAAGIGALLGLPRVEPAAVPITLIPNDKVAAAFAKGAPLLETADFKVHASRREGAGKAEVHVREADIIHVLEGSATLVTGGTVIDGKTVEPDEIRGSAIVGGQVSHLVKGDVVVVPKGVPHWFREVPEPLTYYVVKVH
jgi:glc operon protein GlcG